MGFFSKVFKGVGKVFRKIGRGLKKIAAKFGKFMGKIGIIGQIGLSLLLPGIGTMLGNLAGSMINTTLGGIAGAVVKGAGAVLNTAVNIGTKVGSTFKTITEGVTKVMGEVATVGLDKLGLSDSTFGKYLANKGFTGDIGGAFTDAVSGVKASVGDLFSSDTLTGLNKYATESLQTEALGMSRKEYLESIPESLAETERDKILSSVPDSLADSSPLDTTSFGSKVPDPLQNADWAFSPEGQAARISAAEKAGIQLPEWDKVLNVSEVATDKTIMKTQSSLLNPIVEGIKGLPGKAVEAAGEFFTDLPGKGAEAAMSGVETGVKSKVLNELGVETQPVQNITSISGYVPTIDMSGTSDIGATPAQFDAVAYMQNNVDSFNMNPYGFNAAVYNAGAYQKRMAEYGFAV
jgi:hypothetical protein